MQPAKARRSRSKSALKKIGSHPMMGVPLESYLLRLRNESHRGAIMLAASFIEDTLAARLRIALLRADPQLEDQLFGVAGILSSFTSKATMAAALKIISPGLRELIEHVGYIRNAAAHFASNVDFAAPELRNAVLALLDDDNQKALVGASSDEFRDAFILSCLTLQQLVSNRWKRGDNRAAARLAMATIMHTIDERGGIPYSQLYNKFSGEDHLPSGYRDSERP